MIIWLNGCFGVGKAATATMLHKFIANSHIYDPEQVGAFLWDNFPEPLKRKGDFQAMTMRQAGRIFRLDPAPPKVEDINDYI